jgi:hypothetical protein
MRPLTALIALASLALLATSAGSSGAETPTPVPVPRFEGRPIVRPAPAPRFEIVGESISALPTFFSPQGQRFVLGALGERYRIHIVNPTPARVEAVVSVDGLDAVDGKPASLAKRGYIIPALGDVTVDGWRTSLDTVAAFRFSSVRDSYASRTQTDRNVGVIGVAFFRENPPPPPPPIAWVPPSAARGAPAPSAAGAGGRAEAKAADAAGLGTRFGESHDSRVVEVSFVRAEATPVTLGQVRYDDREGLLARGIALPPVRDGRWAELQRRDTAQPFAESRFAQAPR